MQASELITRLRKESRIFEYNGVLSRLASARERCRKQPLISNKLVLYNYEMLNELINTKRQFHGELDDALVLGTEKELCTCLDAYAEGSEYYKEVLRIVSLYLCFIARRPLHPAGVFASDGKYVTQDGKVICPLRDVELYRPGSLCKYCCSTTPKI